MNELTHEAIYNTRIRKLLIYHLIDGEVVDGTIEDFAERKFQIKKDDSGNSQFEYQDQEGEIRRFPLIQIDS